MEVENMLSFNMLGPMLPLNYLYCVYIGWQKACACINFAM